MTWPISDARIAAKAPGSTDLFADLRNRIVYHDGLFYGVNQASNVPLIANGSFEADDNLTASPTGWTASALTGGDGYVTTSDASHGAKSYVAVHPGGATNGGKTLATTDALPVSMGQAFELYFDAYATNATVRVKVDALWYDKDGAQIGATENVYDQNGTFPTSWTTICVGLSPYVAPSSARFMTLLFTLGAVGTDPVMPTNIFLDNVCLTGRRMFSRTTIIAASASWTVPAGVTRARMQLVGAGGNYSYTTFSNGGGGGAGYCEKVVSVTPGQVVVIQVGTQTRGLDGGATTALGMVAQGGFNSGEPGSGYGGDVNLTGQFGSVKSTYDKSSYDRSSCGLGWFGGYGAGSSANSSASGGIVIITY
jgi:hypothetical protein